MANSSQENSPKKSDSPKNGANANANENPNDDAVSVPAAAPLVRALQPGEGSSSVPPVVQENIEGFPPVVQEKGFSSSSSTSSSPAATPPRRVVEIVLGGMKTGGGSGEGSAKKKRVLSSSGKKGEETNQGAEKKQRKKAEMDSPKSDPICSLCGKRFGSWKGVFGHLRAHPERDWRGAFPPPKVEAGSWSPIKMSGPYDYQALQVQLLAPTLLDLARETLSKMRQESTAGDAAGSSRVGNLDLNKMPESSSSQSPPPPPPEGGDDSGSGGLDLNKPPPPGSDDEKNDNE